VKTAEKELLTAKDAKGTRRKSLNAENAEKGRGERRERSFNHIGREVHEEKLFE